MVSRGQNKQLAMAEKKMGLIFFNLFVWLFFDLKTSALVSKQT